jgi:hypothetical protein
VQRSHKCAGFQPDEELSIVLLVPKRIPVLGAKFEIVGTDAQGVRIGEFDPQYFRASLVAVPAFGFDID